MARKLSLPIVILVAAATIVSACTCGNHESKDAFPWSRLRKWSSMKCIAPVVELLRENEGWHEWVYDHPSGFRAVAAGYNMDEDKETRMAEFEVMGADFEQVYQAEAKLDDDQILALTIMDATRALHRARKNVKAWHELCCPVRAVFADIQHSCGGEQQFPKGDMGHMIEKASKERYEAAADELGRTLWCAEELNMERCRKNVHIMADGC